MTFQTDAPYTHLSLQASNRLARETARLVAEGDLDIAPPYQRASVWTREQRMNLVRSWCQGIPVPAIIVNTRATRAFAENTGIDAYAPGNCIYAVIDGKQRVESAVAWFDGDLAVPASWFAADAVVETVETDDGPYVTYLGLTGVAQRLFSHRAMLAVVEATLPSIEAEADLYLLVNTGGTPQSAEDLSNAAAYAFTG